MFFPESLFLLSSRDQQVTWLDPLIRRISATIAAGTVEAFEEVPVDRALIVQSLAMHALPGAAQNIENMAIALTPPGNGARIFVTVDRTTRAVNLQAALNWTGSIIVPPGWNVTVSGGFGAAAVANSVVLDIIGMLIPIGNVQRI